MVYYWEQLGLLSENSDVIYHRVNAIKDVSEPEEKVSELPVGSGILKELWDCVYLLKTCNNVLGKSRDALVRFVG